MLIPDQPITRKHSYRVLIKLEDIIQKHPECLKKKCFSRNSVCDKIEAQMKNI